MTSQNESNKGSQQHEKQKAAVKLISIIKGSSIHSDVSTSLHPDKHNHLCSTLSFSFICLSTYSSCGLRLAGIAFGGAGLISNPGRMKGPSDLLGLITLSFSPQHLRTSPASL